MSNRGPRVDEYLALAAARDHVNVFIHDGGIVADPPGLVGAGHASTTGRGDPGWGDTARR